MTNVLYRLVGLQPGEGRLAGLLGALMVTTALGAGVGTSGIEALFFARFGTSSLPILYMVQGVFTLVVTLAVTGLLGRFSRSLIYLLLPVCLGAVLAAARLATGWTAALPGVWLLKEAANSLLGLYVWGVAGALCDTRQAKRLFPLFSAGRILGSVLGGLITAPLVTALGSENLVLVWAVSLGAAFAFTQLLLGGRSLRPQARRGRGRRLAGPARTGFIVDMQQGYRFVRGSRLMAWISLAAALFSTLYFWLALPFSQAAAAQFTDEARLAGFLGQFQAVTTAAAFLASLFLANRVYSRLGVMRAILALPVIYLGGFAALAIWPAFPMLVGYKFMQMFWMSGIADSAYQAMFNSVPAERRDQVRGFIDGVPSQAGTFLAGAFLIIGERALSAGQLYVIGIFLGAACTYAVWRAGRAYSGALAAALKTGQPQLFTAEGAAGLRNDATALATVQRGLEDADPAIRRVTVEILADLPVPDTAAGLVRLSTDADASLRAGALRALATLGAAPALLDVAERLDDPEPDVRLAAVDALARLAGFHAALRRRLEPMLDDPDAQVRCRAALALLTDGANERAFGMLRNLAMMGEPGERVIAIRTLGQRPDPGVALLLETELRDNAAPAMVRREAATALGACGSAAIGPLADCLADADRSVRDSVAEALGRLGEAAVRPVADALRRPASEHGAIHALEHLPTAGIETDLLNYARARIALAAAMHQDGRTLAGCGGDLRMDLLAESALTAARTHGLHALRALALLGERDSLAPVIAALGGRDAGRYGDALETIESLSQAATLKPLIQLWETLPAAASAPEQAEPVLLRLLESTDDWLRACAALASETRLTPKLKIRLAQLADTDLDPLVRAEAARAAGGETMDTLATLSLMERILFLRRVPLFANLPPADLKQVAAISSEMLFSDGDLLAEQGEPGEELFVIVAGGVSVRVSAAGGATTTVAQRKSGDYVGEMALISQEPRIASLVAVGDVRTICIDRKAFEQLLRERPEVSLAVMRTLCVRLKELSK